MGKKIKVTIIALSSLAAIALILVIAYSVFTSRSLPKTGGKLTLPGLEAPVEIIRDSNGVPHIYAENRHDLFFAQGFVHAQDRFWQMEFWRRIGSGRLSELFGESQLDSDIFLRTMGFARIAEEEWELMEEEYKNYMLAYSKGVNAWIQNKNPEKLALEFSLLKLTGVEIEIELWKPEHSLSWAKVMSFDLGGNMNTERLAMDILRENGIEKTETYFSQYNKEYPIIVSDEEYQSYRTKFALPPLLPRIVKSEDRLGLFSGGQDSKGTNGWVISGEHTASGLPILANDMHLAIQMPSIWYEAGLHCSGPKPIDVKGYSFAGVPGIIAGHNRNIAWGPANASIDVQDLYFEKISTENPDLYWNNEKWNPMEIIYETIEIEGEDEPYIHRVRKTGNGPLLSDLTGYERLKAYSIDSNGIFPDNISLSAVSVRWTALEPGYILKSILMLNEAENYDDFKEALRYWTAPGQSIVYADTKGNIAYQLTGKTPIRREGTGTGPMPGWDEEYQWKGFIPYEDMPASFNPEKGYIVAANHAVVNESFPYYFSHFYSYGFRAQRIVELMEGILGHATVDSIEEMQFDVKGLGAVEILKFLKESGDFRAVYEEMDEIPDDESSGDRKKREKKKEDILKLINEAYARLSDWDGVLKREESEPVIYHCFFKHLIDLTFSDMFLKEHWPAKSLSRYKNTLIYLLEYPDHVLWDDTRTPEIIEDAPYIISKAMVKAILEGEEALGAKLEKWEWGDLHTAEFRNQTLGESGIPPIENIFNRGPFPVDGGGNTVSVTAWRTWDTFEVNHIASMRAIYDMSDLSNSRLIHTTGQSGHPASGHYDDFIPLWQNGEYHGNNWEREDVLNNERKTLKLIPKE